MPRAYFGFHIKRPQSYKIFQYPFGKDFATRTQYLGHQKHAAWTDGSRLVVNIDQQTSVCSFVYAKHLCRITTAFNLLGGPNI